MDSEAFIRRAPTGARNGLDTELKPYVYRGALPLEVELPFLCAGGCGRRLETDRWPLCAVCRGTTYSPPGKCPTCGYKRGGQNCRILCEGAPGKVRVRAG